MKGVKDLVRPAGGCYSRHEHSYNKREPYSRINFNRGKYEINLIDTYVVVCDRVLATWFSGQIQPPASIPRHLNCNEGPRYGSQPDAHTQMMKSLYNVGHRSLGFCGVRYAIVA